MADIDVCFSLKEARKLRDHLIAQDNNTLLHDLGERLTRAILNTVPICVQPRRQVVSKKRGGLYCRDGVRQVLGIEVRNSGVRSPPATQKQRKIGNKTRQTKGVAPNCPPVLSSEAQKALEAEKGG